MDILTIKTVFAKNIISKIVTRVLKRKGFKDSGFSLQKLEINKGADSEKIVIETSFALSMDRKDLEDFLVKNDIL